MSAIPAAAISEKGARYLSQLDQALCNGEWSNISELARKTDKHAADRKCFTLAARSEAQIASAPNRLTSGSSSSISSLGELVPKLTEAISAEEKFPEDAYAAKVCLAEIYWLQDDLEAALKALPQDGVPTKSIANHAVALGWMEVCEAKAAYIKVAALESTGREDEARRESLVAAARTPGSRTPELRRWTERLLARICMLMSQRQHQPSLQTLSQALRCFVSWFDFWQRASASTSGNSAGATRGDIPRRRVWKAYYDLLSLVLHHGLMYNPSPSSASDLLILRSEGMSDEQYAISKSRQRLAMKKVGMTYESLLLNETQFPKASQTNTEIEEWVQQEIINWKIFSGPGWTDSELGEGGKESLSRGVLDVLYRAATKTYHSTAILRHLFTVHAAIGEFELAIHAFNSYVEIISQEKARMEKTGKSETGFDTDDSALTTAAEAVRLLCRYGDREQGEKAMSIGKTIEQWLGQRKPSSVEDAKTNSDDNRVKIASNPSRTTEQSLKPETFADAYRAMGTAQAHWARLTYEPETRSVLQTDAINNLRLAQKYAEGNIEIAYALALVLAETRNVSAAAQVIKNIIASSQQVEGNEDEEEEVDEDRKRMLIPAWHMLALCLTAKDEYEQAVKMCEAAFDQFGDDNVLFGIEGTRMSNDDEKAPPSRSRRGIVDLMEGLERESLLQIRMSQLTFVELTEGADAALDISHELLGLYARLFGNPEPYHSAIQKPPPTAISMTPSKLGGTLRSIAGSIRPKTARTSGEKDPRVGSFVSLPPKGDKAMDAAPNSDGVDVPIAITVTNEDGVRTEKSHHHHRHLPFVRRGTYGESGAGVREKRPFWMEGRPSTPVQKTQIPEDSAVAHETPIKSVANQSVSSSSPATPEQALNEVDHNSRHDTLPLPSGHEEQPPRQDVRLPAPDPASNLVPDARLPSAQDRQQKISLLIKIWLFIAGLYLRSELLDDAASAINEGSKLVESFEAEVAAEHSSARRFYEKGWGGGKSVDGLWADVFSARGQLALARALPFEAISHFEQALAHFSDHPEAIIGISNLLMDMYEEKIPAEEPQILLSSRHSHSSSSLGAGMPPPPQPLLEAKSPTVEKDQDIPSATNKKASHRNLTPAELNRLAARDRAYLLLSNLTRLGNGWDNSEAWFTLARAHELSKQTSKAKQALWWVVELEENEPLRPWREISPGGFTL